MNLPTWAGAEMIRAEDEGRFDAKDAEIARLRDAVFNADAKLADRDAEIARLRAIANWAAGRMLDFGDIYGHEKALEHLGGIEDV